MTIVRDQYTWCASARKRRIVEALATSDTPLAASFDVDLAHSYAATAFCSYRRGQASARGSWLDGDQASRGDVLSVKAHARYTGTNMSSYRDSSPLTMRSYSLSKLAVMGPILPSPIGYLSTEMIGTISMAVPQKKASSAM